LHLLYPAFKKQNALFLIHCSAFLIRGPGLAKLGNGIHKAFQFDRFDYVAVDAEFKYVASILRNKVPYPSSTLRRGFRSAEGGNGENAMATVP
jgi:hypothetical protein